MNTTTDPPPDPAPPGTPPAEADLIREAREMADEYRRAGFDKTPVLLDSFADALERAARERDAWSDEAAARLAERNRLIDAWRDALTRQGMDAGLARALVLGAAGITTGESEARP